MMGDYSPFTSTCLALVGQGTLQINGQPLLESTYSSDQIRMDLDGHSSDPLARQQLSDYLATLQMNV